MENLEGTKGSEKHDIRMHTLNKETMRITKITIDGQLFVAESEIRKAVGACVPEEKDVTQCDYVCDCSGFNECREEVIKRGEEYLKSLK
jgi:hypothetical protein